MAKVDLTKIKVTKVVDERAHACPGPLIETKTDLRVLSICRRRGIFL